MENQLKNCENCGRRMPRASYIPFNDGMIVCEPCYQEWQALGEPQSIAEYAQAIANREDYQSDLIAKQ